MLSPDYQRKILRLANLDYCTAEEIDVILTLAAFHPEIEPDEIYALWRDSFDEP